MKMHRSRTTRQAGRRRLMAEPLEARRLFSAAAIMSLNAPVTLYPAPSGCTGLTVGQDGAIWYAASNSLERLTSDGLATEFQLPDTSAGASPLIVSNVAISSDNSAWFVVQTGTGNVLERMTADGHFSVATAATTA